MNEQILQEAGLTKGESKVYLALVLLGESSVTPIAREAKVSLSKIYEILENLIKKGLVSSIVKNNVKHFSAAEPERILDYLEKKKEDIIQSEEKVKRIIPQIKLMSQKDKPQESGTVYQGINGIKTFYEEVLRNSEKGDEILVMGIPRESAKKHEGYFLDWNKRRAKKSISIKLLFDYDVTDLGKKRKKIKLSEVRYLPQKMITPAWILITKNLVATIHIVEKPICFVIKDKKAAESYSSFFEVFWDLSSNHSNPTI